MRIILNDERTWKKVLADLLKHLPNNKILIDHFGSFAGSGVDYNFDGDDCHVMGVMEHIEPSRTIHSGDSNAMLPEFNLSHWLFVMEKYAGKVPKALRIEGLSIFSLL